jgi:anthranilate phosphoribosyltransferase
MKTILNRLLAHEQLDRNEAREALMLIAEEKCNASQMAAFMTVYLMRNITVNELNGFRDAMLDLCIKVNIDEPCMDVCGTGGDGKDTFNISTTAAFVIAGAGQKVIKHGNYGVSSVCGSSNLLQSLGYQFTKNETILKKQLEQSGICFLHAPLFHPAMKAVASIRKELGVKTFFNMLGPLVNPARPRCQLTGVFSKELARIYQYLLRHEGIQFGIVHSEDGYDEISLTDSFRLITNDGERLIKPEEINQSTLNNDALFGGSSVEENSRIFLNILKNKGSEAQMSVVKVNAAVALQISGHAADFQEGLAFASESLVSGKALQSFEKLLSNQ